MSRITIEDLKAQTGVEDWQLSLECRDDHLLDITKHIGNYTKFASRMHLYDSDIQTIIANPLWPTHGQKAEQVFKQWKKVTCKSKATYREFVQICLELSEGYIAREMCQHCARIKTVAPGKNDSEVDAPMSLKTTTQKTVQWPTATESQLSQECSDEALHQLSSVISNYNSFKYMLGLTDAEINEIDSDPRNFYSTQCKFYSALKKWKTKNIDFECPSHSKATYARLVLIAKKTRDGIAARHINKVCVEAASKPLVSYCKPEEIFTIQQPQKQNFEATCSGPAASSNPNSLLGWFREIGLMDRDIDILTDEGYATKQTFSLLTASDLNDLRLTNGGKRLLTLHIKSSESTNSESVPTSTQATEIVSPPKATVPPVQVEYLNTHTHLSDVYSQTFEARAKWFNIGLQLGVPKHMLDSVTTTPHLYNDEGYYMEVLTCWMKEGSATINSLVEVLEGPTVQMFDVAKKARKLDNKDRVH